MVVHLNFDIDLPHTFFIYVIQQNERYLVDHLSAFIGHLHIKDRRYALRIHVYIYG